MDTEDVFAIYARGEMSLTGEQAVAPAVSSLVIDGQRRTPT